MLAKLRLSLTYSNVMATLAVFLALGATSYAAITVTGKNVRNGSLTGRDIKNNSLRTSDVRNGSLLSKDFKAGELPSNTNAVNAVNAVNAANAGRLDNLDSTSFVQNGSGAGGDLTGSYPAPTIAPGAVTPETLAAFPSAEATISADLPISNGILTSVPLDDERYDTASMHSTTTNNHLVTAPISGTYLATANIMWEFNDAGPRVLWISVGNSRVAVSRIEGDGSSDQSASAIVDLAAGDSLQMQVIQSSGGPLNLDENGRLPALALTYLHP